MEINKKAIIARLQTFIKVIDSQDGVQAYVTVKQLHVYTRGLVGYFEDEIKSDADGAVAEDTK